jgi:hypothetical protein
MISPWLRPDLFPCSPKIECRLLKGAADSKFKLHQVATEVYRNFHQGCFGSPHPLRKFSVLETSPLALTDFASL